MSILALVPILILLGSILMVTLPVYPKVTATIVVQLREPKFSLQSAKLERLTFAGGSSLVKNQIILYPISTTPTTTFELAIEVSYARQVLAQSSYSALQAGLYSFSVVLDPRPEQTNVFYHLKMTVKLPYESPIVIEADVPPA